MATAEPQLAVTAVGGPTALINFGGLRLLTDPTFSPPGVQESAPGRPLTKTEGPALLPEDLGPLDAVLLSHDQHADNLDRAGREILTSIPLALSTCSAAGRLGGSVRGLRPWESVSLSGPSGQAVHVTAVPARHGPPGCEPLTGEVVGFVLHGADLPVVYVSGDNASLDAVQEIAARFPVVDLAVLFAGAARTSLFSGAPLTLTSRDAAAAAIALDARTIVPVHVRGWEHFAEGTATLRAAFEAAGVADRLRLLDPGATLAFETPNRR